MKKLFTRLTSFLLVVALLCNVPCFDSAKALTPTYTVSSSYSTSVYYERLCNVNITGNQRNDIIAVAESQMGYYESNRSDRLDGKNYGSGTYDNYTEYGYWYSLSHGSSYICESWCAMFISWCAEQAGIPKNIINSHSSASPNGANFGVNTKEFGDYNPQKGDIAYIKTTEGNHVGLVYGVDDNYIYTIDGNVGDGGTRVKEKLNRYYKSNGAYEFGGQSIVMFGIPNYTNNENKITGKCGDNVNYSFDKTTGEMVISGTGDMRSWGWDDWYNIPWCEYLDKIQKLTVNEGVTSIGDFAFEGCSNLTTVSMSTTIKDIGACAFCGCQKLESIVIGENVEVIGYEAFAGCDGLKNIALPKSLITIVSGAFGNCNSLTDVYYEGSEEEWSKVVIEDYNEPLKNATIHYNSSLDTEDVGFFEQFISDAVMTFWGIVFLPLYYLLKLLGISI